MNKIWVIGIGYKPFEKRARGILLSADVILTSDRLFEVFKEYEEYAAVAEKVTVVNKVDQTMEFIRSNYENQAIVLLASGDPMFFGIGRRVVSEFGPDGAEMFPDLSSIQVAFSRIKEAWDDAFLMSLHGGPDPEKRRRLPYKLEDIPHLLEHHRKMAILTDRENNPSEIARRLSSFILQPSSLKMFVCERLGYADEKITSGSPEEFAGRDFPGPNVVILLKESGGCECCCVEETNAGYPAIGITEAEFSHSRGLITKDEVRAVSLHKLRLPRSGVLWDIGAGSGSVSVEAARLSPGLKVLAIEKNEEQLKHSEENKIRFSATNVTVIAGEAPEALRELPSPDRVFIGGSGGQLSDIIGHVTKRMREGIVVINAATIETLNEALTALAENGFETDVSQISVAREKLLGGKRHMTSLNPIFVIKGEKG